MTTETKDASHSDHMSTWGDRGFAVFNPDSKPIEELPFIYGFNNGGSEGLLNACLLAEDGEPLGDHVCSAENYMYGDLGIIPNRRQDRHADFRRHYPGGYRMDFIPYPDLFTHRGLAAALERSKTRHR